MYLLVWGERSKKSASARNYFRRLFPACDNFHTALNFCAHAHQNAPDSLRLQRPQTTSNSSAALDVTVKKKRILPEGVNC
ncbi:hypothetical protein XELAEV_18004701mg [Xenopus laevis]|uniref:Uncharacterized protein n=1 Tax=Xenopus laevis TaxID=8355 RepID=A0A974BQQ7_XENLA|nr:hypothetical protein XELAEV_18004701mg [Xenopus laevis]